MKVSVTLEQAAKNLGTTPELAKQTWMGLAVTQNGYVFVGNDKKGVAKYMLASDRNRIDELRYEEQTPEILAETKRLLSARVDLETAFNNINK